jgi:chorismate mutase
MHVNTAKPQDQVRFVYLRGARALRPDLAQES